MPRIRQKRIVGLFSGIGGFEVGFERAGYKTAMMCEIDDIAREVLKDKFPGVRLSRDVKKINKLPGKIDVLCAGFPCQDLSSNGLKEGIDGDRSSLVYEALRIIENNDVEWVVFENVSFMLKLNKGQAIKEITEKLEELGYNWAYRVIDSGAFVPQRRERVYIVGSRNNDPRDVLLSEDFGSKKYMNANYDIQPNVPIGFYWTEGKYSIGVAYDSFPTLKAGSTIGIPSPPALACPDGTVGTPEIRDAERLQGFDEDWTAIVSKKWRESNRWKLVGNAVTVDVIEWLANKINNPIAYNGVNDEIVQDFHKWPDSAWCVNHIKGISLVSAWPVDNSDVSVMEYMNYPLKPLSYKASNGFLNRVNAGGLKMPYGFKRIIEEHRNNMEARV